MKEEDKVYREDCYINKQKRKDWERKTKLKD